MKSAFLYLAHPDHTAPQLATRDFGVGPQKAIRDYRREPVHMNDVVDLRIGWGRHRAIPHSDKALTRLVGNIGVGGMRPIRDHLACFRQVVGGNCLRLWVVIERERSRF